MHLEFDPQHVTHEQLLDVLFDSYDPTTLNRQGPDVGSQYLSAIFHHSPEQKDIATATKEKLAASGRFRIPILTAIEPAATFWRAEDPHQRYLEKRGLPHCSVQQPRKD